MPGRGRTSQNGYQPPGANTIRILVATDNHVGFNERDAIRGDDSWRAFEEVMQLAETEDVDMVLLAGDLFHENKPSRKAMFHVMKSLRNHCYGAKPCELEMISDPTEAFAGQFNEVNYEDPDINVAIPVFSIHGNHDDPSGEGHYAALDILQVSGLVNYYGRTPESDNIEIKPVLLQKGNTKLALYGMSNVRDERLFRTFRDGKVKFFQPTAQKDNWFNLMSVHQNHHAYTDTGYLPENFLPDFIDLVVWGHEHECIIDARYNPEMNFHVMQPGSSVATSLMPGEAVEKHVAILDITGKDFKQKNIRLKTVRPFVMKEIVLQDEKGMKTLAKKVSNRTEITNHLQGIVEDLIENAKTSWLEAQGLTEPDEDNEIPLPLVRLRVEYTAPEGGKFDMENPQRFSNRFIGRVANQNDIVQFHRKKAATTRKAKDEPEMPEESIMEQLSIDTVKVEKLVREFLTAQKLSFLPQALFGDAVSQYVDKDDKHAMEQFIEGNLKDGVKQFIKEAEEGDDDIENMMEKRRTHLEELFDAGHIKRATKAMKPKPDHWDSDMEGHWADNPASIIRSENEEEEEDDEEDGTPAPKTKAATRGRGKAAASTRGGKKAAPSKAAAAKKTTTRGKKKAVEESEESEDEDEDIVMLDDDDDDDEEEVVAPRRGGKTTSKASTKAPAKAAPKKAPARATTASRSAAGKQTQLNFGSQSQASQRPAARATSKPFELSDDEISDDEDAFAPAPSSLHSRRR